MKYLKDLPPIKFFAVSALLATLGVAQSVVLWWLPYSTSLVERAELGRTDAAPSGGTFRVGSVRWVVPRFVSDPSLDAYRKVYASSSGGARGLEAAIRVSDDFAGRFPHGEPRDEFLYPDYDPVRELYSHLGGQGGHCVTRAGLVATTLLAAGIPARVLQLIPPDGGGHNIIEVWDDTRGWVVFDPTTGYAFTRPDSGGKPGPFLSAAEAARSAGSLAVVSVGQVPANVGDPATFISRRFFEGTLIYPEPWLYTRAGERYSYWPFGGRFVQVGVTSWRVGPLQSCLRPGIGLCMLGSAATSGAGGYSLLRRLRVALGSSPPADGAGRGAREWVRHVLVANRARPKRPEGGEIGAARENC